MAPPPTTSPVTGDPVPPYYIHASSVHFQDTHGRSVLLRGVNLSGAAKCPPSQPSWSQDGFWDEAEAGRGDWINATLNLDDGSADVHLARLRAWGFNMLRYVFTWEALEHEGPGKYDYAYMDYVVKVLYKCKEYGFRVFMDPHQDVIRQAGCTLTLQWSRFSGGSGAPLWTIYACGVDPHKIVPTHSALVHCDYPSKENPDPASLPAMIWSSNYYRPFGHTVWTLFFAGKTYAPRCVIDGVNIQDWLQDHFINACGELAKHIAKAPGLNDECVLGWDSINEPAEGLIGVHDLDRVPPEQPVKLGPVPTPFENMRLASGEPVTVDTYYFGAFGPTKNGSVTLDPKGQQLWLTPEADQPPQHLFDIVANKTVWAQHGVWDPKTSTLLIPDYFHTLPTDPSHKVDYVADFWRQHWLSYASTVRTWHPEAIHFMNTTVFKALPELPESFLNKRACATPHFYDGFTLMSRHWNWYNADAVGYLRGKYWSVVQSLRVGEANIRRCIQDQLGVLKQDTADSLGEYPTLIGEIGCPYDMDGRRAYGYADGGKGKGDYSSQQRAWDCSVNATDGANVLNFTLWTYVPQHSHQWGDNWNGEDLSLWSRDDTRAAGSAPGYHAFASTDSALVNADDTTGLLGHQGGSNSAALADSVASTATLAPSTATLVAPARATPKDIESGAGVTPQLLLDGARAAAAFCRPFPTATVGRPVRLDFDIKSSVFKLVVAVGPADAAAAGAGVATEVYVPFVHYAGGLDWAESVGGGGALLPSPCASGTATPASTSHLSLPDAGKTVPADLRAPAAGAGGGVLALDIDVAVSAGSYTTQGQMLRWTYPIPAAETQYTLEIRRAGGSLYAAAEGEDEGGVANMLAAWCSIQ